MHGIHQLLQHQLFISNYRHFSHIIPIHFQLIDKSGKLESNNLHMKRAWQSLSHKNMIKSEQITAICDIVPFRIDDVQHLLKKRGLPEVQVYTGSEAAWSVIIPLKWKIAVWLFKTGWNPGFHPWSVEEQSSRGYHLVGRKYNHFTMNRKPDDIQ